MAVLLNEPPGTLLQEPDSDSQDETGDDLKRKGETL